MNEVIFRAKDLIRPAGIAAPVLALVLETAFGLFALADLGTVLLVAMTLALVLPFLLVALRAWTGVGTDKYHSTTEFLANTRQVMDRWERNTAPDRRVGPRPRLWDVLSIPVIGSALGAAFVAVVLTQLR
ncbi:hypothetical protein ACIQOV_25730 [Kitasatospora sp. NPDC091257]|uniref:hypothetical protein n=1 Tax=Kitasatospora sp. NPDC091257 TaxID=3364084 RepID=UPI003801C315